MQSTQERAPAPTATHDEALQLLIEIRSAVAQSQSALLSGRLSQLEDCTATELILCRKLQLFLAASPKFKKPGSPHLVNAVALLQQDTNILAGVLSRMRRNLQSLQHALLGPATLYNDKPTRTQELTI